MFLLELNIYNLCDTLVHKTPLRHVLKGKKMVTVVWIHYFFFSSSDNSSTHILLAGFTYYGIACIHTALSVSSVAGRDFFFFLNGWYMCHGSMGFYSAFRHRKGFLYEWPLTKAVIYFWFVERVTFHFTDIFSLISETSRL